MAVIPDKLLQQIEFCEAHLPAWTAAPAAAIGLTAAQITSLSTLTTAARASYNAALAARQASKAATNGMHEQVELMREFAADLVRVIKGFADLQTVPGNVYTLAQIPQPLPPEPLPAPGKPRDFLVNIETGGALTLSWAGDFSAASSGTFYSVYRKLPGMTDFVMIGGTSGSTTEQRRMKFTDATIPSSAAGVGAQYKIQGQRGTVLGTPSDGITVEFGTDSGGGGAMTLRVTQDESTGGTSALRVAA